MARRVLRVTARHFTDQTLARLAQDFVQKASPQGLRGLRDLAQFIGEDQERKELVVRFVNLLLAPFQSAVVNPELVPTVQDGIAHLDAILARLPPEEDPTAGVTVAIEGDEEVIRLKQWWWDDLANLADPWYREDRPGNYAVLNLNWKRRELLELIHARIMALPEEDPTS
jgi:hypothetical protein